ncbi:MAG: flagellar biosynthetic protein FliR [Deltaproteobacteria bacterium]|nr:flagellar biosynthetic protein FliR [Deltaproteobacteria bacterium]
MDQLLALPVNLFNNLDVAWSFFLLLTRYVALFSLIPGLGEGPRGLLARMPAVMVLAVVSVLQGPYAEPPHDWVMLLQAFASEICLGAMLGMVPTMIIAGVDTAAQLSSTTMGLGAAQLMDPRLGGQSSALGRICGSLVICLFLLLGGHHVIIYAAAGLGGEIVPGTYLIGEGSLNLLMERSANIFKSGVMLSAPVIVALLLTQFLMGLISKAVPTVNIFIVSFPLTIGIGLILTILALPEMIQYSRREMLTLETQVSVVVQDAGVE